MEGIAAQKDVFASENLGRARPTKERIAVEFTRKNFENESDSTEH